MKKLRPALLPLVEMFSYFALFVLIVLLAGEALAQEKFSLQNRASPAPSGATGDTWYASSATQINRLAIGATAGMVYCVKAGVPAWCVPGEFGTFNANQVPYTDASGHLTDGNSGYHPASIFYAPADYRFTLYGEGRTAGSSTAPRWPFEIRANASGGGYSSGMYIGQGSPASVGDGFYILKHSGAAAVNHSLYVIPSGTAWPTSTWADDLFAYPHFHGFGLIFNDGGSSAHRCEASGAEICVGSGGDGIGFSAQANGDVRFNNILWHTPSAQGGANTVLRNDGSGYLTWVSQTSGTATSVGLSMPSQFTVTNSPVTTTGTLTAAWNTQVAKYFLAGPTSGADAAPTFRTIAVADVPLMTGATSHSDGTAGLVVQPNTGEEAKFLRADATWATPGGSTPVTTKGDIYTYSTGADRLGVGIDGQLLSANSGESTGLRWINGAGTGTLITLKETVFAGITPAGYANGSTTTIDGCDYYATVPTSAAVDIVASGLRLRVGTSSSSNFTRFTIRPGGAGDFLTIVGEARMRRGKWAYWMRFASYSFTNTNAAVRGSFGTYISGTTKWGLFVGRNRNADGAPNTTTGGLGAYWNWNGLVDPSSYPGAMTPDVLAVYFRSQDQADVYYGTYSSGWPTLESMTLWGTIRMSVGGGGNGWVSGSLTDLSATGTAIEFMLGGSAASTGTYEMIWDRWRITTWE